MAASTALHLFWVGELLIAEVWYFDDRNHKYETEGHLQSKLKATFRSCSLADPNSGSAQSSFLMALLRSFSRPQACIYDEDQLSSGMNLQLT